ncbi:hypothetical protein [Croceicoccus sediminis]|uniref:hypothetical protein n=1 Tax=Croceicoccus sediminis TaxID=2571150 RepID=UPI00118323CF|nr:hypothetical protein [Croceicoccus sediminis]
MRKAGTPFSISPIIIAPMDRLEAQACQAAGAVLDGIFLKHRSLAASLIGLDQDSARTCGFMAAAHRQ